MSILRSLVIALVCAIPALAQQTFNVPSANYPTIQTAIDAAADGDTVQIAAGLYTSGLFCNKGITLVGAGAGLTVLDPNFTAKGIDIVLTAGQSMTVRDLTVTRGNSCLYAYNPTSTSVAFLRVKNCVISLGQRDVGAGIFSQPGIELELTNTEVLDNGLPPGIGLPNSSGGGVLVYDDFVATDCKFMGNVVRGDFGSGGAGAAVYLFNKAPGTFTRCHFENNSARAAACILVNPGGFVPEQLIVQDCIFRNNTASGDAACIIRTAAVGGGVSIIENCLFTGNSSQVGPLKVNHLIGDSIEINNCTFADNDPTTTAQALMQLSPQGNLKIRNSIFSGNGSDHLLITPQPGTTGISKNNLSETSNFSGFGTFHSNIEGIAAGFRNRAAGDYRLLAASPAVDAGTILTPMGTTDLDGLPRNQLLAPDIGCYELQPGEEDPGTTWAGTVPDLMSGFEDVLLVNGTAGDVGRRVNTAIGSPTTISVDAAPGTLSGNFIIWGRIGLPGAIETFPIPFAQGSMAFVPHILAVGNPSLFTLASTSLAGGLFAATPAPWSVSGSSLPFPLTFTLQGLIETGGTNVRLTNAITVHNF